MFNLQSNVSKYDYQWLFLNINFWEKIAGNNLLVCTAQDHASEPLMSCMKFAEYQGSEVPSLGTFSGTLSGKWAKVGKMGGNGGK